ncbi:MAG TPA: TadE family protein [Tepidisphaeraceae bacterium]
MGCQSRRATALVEMALALLLLMLLTMGAVEYGWFFLKQQQITNAARQAARVACTADATNLTVKATVDSLMSSYGMGSTGYTQPYSPTNVSSAKIGDSVSVTVSVTYSKITITNFKLLPMPTTVSATVAMVKEGS